MTDAGSLKALIPSLVCDGDEPVFAEPWEARAFAMAVKLNEAGYFTWEEWAQQFGAAIKENTAKGEPLSYFQVWQENLEKIAQSKQFVNSDEIIRRKKEWEEACLRTPHGEPIEL